MNNPLQMIRGMLGQPNPQILAQQILQNNPQFANAIQGQNLQQLAMQQMQGRGINPDMFMPKR